MAVPVVIVFGIFMYAIFLLALSSNGRATVQDRFAKYFKRPALAEVQDQVLRERNERARRIKSEKMQRFGKKLETSLAMSGVKLSAVEYLCSWALATFVPILLVLLFRGNILTALGIGILGFAAPPFLVRRSRKKRQEEFNKQLGESIVIMVNCIKAGFTFQQAMESIASEMQPPISTEFKRTLREIHYGIPQTDALKHMVDRVKNKDLDLLVSAVLTSAQVGGNLSEILEVIAETVRDRIKIKDEVRVLTSSGRSSGMIIGLLPVFIILMLMVINPAYFLTFYESQIGKLMIALSVVLEITGFAIINKIVDIQY